jgi:hypothetical protein
MLGDFMYMWAAGPMAEVVDDPTYQADMQIIELAGMIAFSLGAAVAELRAANTRMRARNVWCYEEAGRRYQRALDLYRLG